MNKKTILLIFSVGILTVIFGTMYVMQQQALRVGANSPQIQIAQDIAANLDKGAKPKDVVSGKVNTDQSLTPFEMIYDKSNNEIAGNGFINGVIPTTVPYGVLQNSNGREYSSVTWQPQKNVRIALVIVQAKNYYVLSGRSLHEVEKQIQTQTQYAFLGWFASVLISLFVYCYSKKKK